uniref:Ig-like domain-containing protein n=1 Tax=Dromaius novaehollandiae TaxID=8790 RepID=A0A8C4JU04_DRONO
SVWEVTLKLTHIDHILRKTQTPISITKPESKTVLISCRVSAPDFATAFIHWYRKSLNAAPERIAYMSSRLFLENSSDDEKLSIEKDLSQSVCTLTVSKVTLQDAATYYCNLHKDVHCFSTKKTLQYLKACGNIPTHSPTSLQPKEDPEGILSFGSEDQQSDSSTKCFYMGQVFSSMAGNRFKSAFSSVQ